MILARLLYGKKIELVIDGTIVDIANVNRARTQKIRRVSGKVWWAMRRRKIVRRDNGKVVEFEEVRYGMLMMVLCDREGRVYDVWITFGSVHEVRAFRERKKRSLWFRGLVENCVVYGDRTCNRWNHSGHSQCKQGEDTEDKEGKREGMVGKEEKEDSSERQWKGGRV